MLHNSMNAKKGTPVTAGTPTSVVAAPGAVGLTTTAKYEQQQKSQ
jgi:hypothetical protein